MYEDELCRLNYGPIIQLVQLCAGMGDHFWNYLIRVLHICQCLVVSSGIICQPDFIWLTHYHVSNVVYMFSNFTLITPDICDKIYGSLRYDIILQVQSVLAVLWLHICLVCAEEQGIRLRLVYPWVKQRGNTLVWKMLVHSWVTEVRIWCRIWCELHFASIHFEIIKLNITQLIVAEFLNL